MRRAYVWAGEGAVVLSDGAVRCPTEGVDVAGQGVDAKAELVVSVLTELRIRLVERGSSLASDSSLDAGLEFHARSIIDETLAGVAGDSSSDAGLVSVDYDDLDALLAHGEFSAARDVDPAEPLMAAEILFGVALPLIAAHIRELAGAGDDLGVARHLHHAIWRRFPPGAIAYVEVLRARLHAAQLDTRQRISRELHDRIAHGIAAGLQRLDLTQTGESDDAVQAAIRILRDALADAQDLALDLRAVVGDRDLSEALEEYAYASGGHGTLPIHIMESGLPTPVTGLVQEELFAIIVESTRNSRQHARDATAVTVRLAWSPTGLVTTVTDDGSGYESADRRPGGLGLKGIAERAEALGAHVSFSGAAGSPRIQISLPFVLPGEQ